MLINLSNHPSTAWDDAQQTAAQKFGEIIDIPFPKIPPDATAEEVANMASHQIAEIANEFSKTEITLHIMGELNFVYAVVRICKTLGIRCVASTTERISKDIHGGKRIVEFQFVQFREYV